MATATTTTTTTTTISKNRVPPPLQLIVVKLFCEAYSCFTREETIYHSLWRQRTGEKKMEIVPLQQNICYQIVVVLEVAFLGKKLAEKNRRKFFAKMARKKQTLSSFWFFVFTMIHNDILIQSQRDLNPLPCWSSIAFSYQDRTSEPLRGHKKTLSNRK